MITRPLGNTGFTPSVVGLGTWNLGNQWGKLTDEESDAILRSAVDAGMTLIDTAEAYGIPNGASELRIGRVLHEFNRADLVLVSKIGNWGKRAGQKVPKTTPDMIRLCGHAIAGRLKTDYIDTILCHEGDIEDPSIYIEGFEKLSQEGFLHNYGISTNNLEAIKRFQERSGGRCAVVEIEYSLLNRKAEEELIPYCRSQGMGILVRSPLAKGVLSGKYDRSSVFTDQVRSGWNPDGKQRAHFERQLDKLDTLKHTIGDRDMIETSLRFITRHPADMVVIPGATTPAQARANAAAGAEQMQQELYEALLDCASP